MEHIACRFVYPGFIREAGWRCRAVEKLARIYLLFFLIGSRGNNLRKWTR